MADMSLKKTPVREQSPEQRVTNFDEVCMGYTEEEAVGEAARCLGCKNRPCTAGCPVGIRIPDFIEKVKERDFDAAYRIISESSSLPAVCGRVCPQENQCEGKCVRGIKGEPVAIGRLERFVADRHMASGAAAEAPSESNGIRVAVVGAGPSGLTCAGELARLGYSVTVFEAFHTAGGVLVYGIPEFRLPKSIVAKEIEQLKSLGVEIMTDMVIGKVLSVDELIERGYKAVFIGSGAGLPAFLGIEGEDSVGVYSANEFLTRINLMKAYRDEYDTPIHRARSIAICGGGNVAMDAARCAKRLGAEHVYIVYRRSLEEMPARREEVHHAMEEGIEFKLLCNPKRILADENGVINGMECIEMELGEPDASGRCRPVPRAGSEFILPVDAAVMAVGTTPNPLIRSTTEGIEADRRGCLIVNEELMTTKQGVYAGGDAVTGAATVILAMGAGKQAAASIHKYLGENA